MLDLLQYFNGRHVVDPSLWGNAIFPELSGFLEQAAASHEPMYLHLDTHSSLAFAVGYCLDPKQGANIVIVQRLRRGRQIWHQEPDHAGDYSQLWDWTEQDRKSNSNDVALAVSVTHDVRQDVGEYVAQQLPSVGRILGATIQPMPTSTTVRDGAHALMLVQGLGKRSGRRATVPRS